MKNRHSRFSLDLLFQKLLILLSAIMLLPLGAIAQTTAPTLGMDENPPTVHAFTNATIIVAPGEVLENATLVIRDGVIESVGRRVNPPADARIWDMTGHTFTPGFIDPYTEIGQQDPREELDRGNLSWNVQLRAHLSATGEYELENDGSEALRNQGFTAALSVPPLGIFKGETAIMSLGEGQVSERVVRPNVAQAVDLTRSWALGYGYPTSDMGAISFIRQTLLDADWYGRAHSAYESSPRGLQRPESNAALEALVDAARGNQPLLFAAESDEEVIRSIRFSEEFSITPWIRGSGHEYRILDYISEYDIPMILPLEFPEKPDVDTPEDAMDEDLADLRHWYLAPENPARVAEAGIEFSLTTSGMEDFKNVLPNIRKAVHAGLDSETALAALTVNPANLLGIGSTHGTLEEGKAASFIISNGDLFEHESSITDVWVDGQLYRVNPAAATDVRGEWTATSPNSMLNGDFTISGTPGSPEGSMMINNEEVEFSSLSFHDLSGRFGFSLSGDDMDGATRVTASLSGDELSGWAVLPEGQRVVWTATRSSTADTEAPEAVSFPDRTLELADIRPAMEYGLESIPEQPSSLLVRNATIWTMGEQGILENADILMRDGEVAEVGQNLNAPRRATIIDAEGKHVTPGLIDPHIHSGTDAVNEVGNAIVPEVRITDVLNINNIWMYRQLAGGLTTTHVMHGSANPIGGQNAPIKLRWGALSHDLNFENAPRTVKFALGENPKRVGSDRYPETRMGTQHIIADRFSQARDYEARWNEWNESGKGIPPRRDLRMEAIVDILNGDILVQSHSYRQDEILALMRLAESFDFKIKAFHHAVEAYKVAPELAEHGAGAAVWSDWSSFKIEAYDGTIFNARLLTEAGVLTSLHSDNSQIASRMNWEAAKMVHAGMEPEDALALVTINTAKVLGLDEYVGSLEPGKHADFVIWSDDPLSTQTKAEQTWIDGRKYFDLETDAQLRQRIHEERAKLIQFMLEAD
ncbi:amidohydrolase family protein [Rhodohalobacter sp. 8-1]|uniref:amidohydrolase family protein n=1 Tax=Rhodohalobacter sp. 8-1 TaxID=3131972 RepID=UPI0030EBEC96